MGIPLDWDGELVEKGRKNQSLPVACRWRVVRDGLITTAVVSAEAGLWGVGKALDDADEFEAQTGGTQQRVAACDREACGQPEKRQDPEELSGALRLPAEEEVHERAGEDCVKDGANKEGIGGWQVKDRAVPQEWSGPSCGEGPDIGRAIAGVACGGEFGGQSGRRDGIPSRL